MLITPRKTTEKARRSQKHTRVCVACYTAAAGGRTGTPKFHTIQYVLPEAPTAAALLVLLLLLKRAKEATTCADGAYATAPAIAFLLQATARTVALSAQLRRRRGCGRAQPLQPVRRAYDCWFRMHGATEKSTGER